MLIDTHAHLFLEEFDPDRDKVLERAHEAGVGYIINAAIDLPSSHRVIDMAKSSPFLPAAVGIHPHSASEVPVDYLSQLSEMADDGHVVAVGEIGLDFHWGDSDRACQVEVFEKQLDLARKENLPVIIHSRDAEELMFAILEKWTTGGSDRPRAIRGVRHCFNLGRQQAARYLEMGFMLSFGGYVTYPTSRLEEVIRAVPLDRLLLETDSPYLPPQTYRGKRNEPSYIGHVAQAVATLLDLGVEEVAHLTTQNASIAFGLSPVSGPGAESRRADI